jgi:hypothetical protein
MRVAAGRSAGLSTGLLLAVGFLLGLAMAPLLT